MNYLRGLQCDARLRDLSADLTKGDDATVSCARVTLVVDDDGFFSQPAQAFHQTLRSKTESGRNGGVAGANCAVVCHGSDDRLLVLTELKVSSRCAAVAGARFRFHQRVHGPALCAIPRNATGKVD
jgi:hypothetical protein